MLHLMKCKENAKAKYYYVFLKTDLLLYAAKKCLHSLQPFTISLFSALLASYPII